MSVWGYLTVIVLPLISVVDPGLDKSDPTPRDKDLIRIRPTKIVHCSYFCITIFTLKTIKKES